MSDDLIIKAIQEMPDDSKNDVISYLLSHFDSEELFRVVSKYMDDTTITRKCWIIGAYLLCEIDIDRAGMRFIDLLKHDNPDFRFRIVKAIYQRGAYKTVPTLIEMIKTEPDPSIRYTIAITLGVLKAKEALPVLEWVIENDHDMNYEDVPVAEAARGAIEKINQHT